MTPTEAASTLRALGWRCEPPEALVAPALAPPATEAPTEPVEGQAWVTTTGTELRVLKICDQYVTLDAGGRQIPRAAWAVWVRLFGARPVIAPRTAPALQPAPTLAPDGGAAVAPPQAPRVGEVWEAGEDSWAPSRIITRIASHEGWPGSGDRCVYFRTRHDNRERCLNPRAWHAWVRRSGARVVA